MGLEWIEGDFHLYGIKSLQSPYTPIGLELTEQTQSGKTNEAFGVAIDINGR
jgi:hypothetical protein